METLTNMLTVLVALLGSPVIWVPLLVTGLVWAGTTFWAYAEARWNDYLNNMPL